MDLQLLTSSCCSCFSALRLKLGLKPLDTTKKDSTGEKSSAKEDVHKPAVNIGQQKKTEALREKMTLAREKRKLGKNLGSVLIPVCSW